MRRVVSLGVMRPKGLGALLKILPGTYRALRSARRDEACVTASIFRRGRQYYAMSVWRGWPQMRAWARGEVHGRLMALAEAQMVTFQNHSWEADDVPSQEEARRRWEEIEARG